MVLVHPKLAKQTVAVGMQSQLNRIRLALGEPLEKWGDDVGCELGNRVGSGFWLGPQHDQGFEYFWKCL